MDIRRQRLVLDAAHKGDRREKSRYPVDLQVKFKVVERGKVVASGTGRTVDMTSAAVAFAPDSPIRVGVWLELALTWPALLDGVCPMQLTVSGRAIRSDSGVSVCSLKKHEFRTVARTAQTVAAQATVRQPQVQPAIRALVA